jgi:hypothetical protein
VFKTLIGGPMKKLLALTLCSLSFAAVASETVSFTHFGNNGGNQSYYACDYAQSQTENFLAVLGAKNIDVSCSGGIQPWGSMQPVSISASFDLPTVVTNAVESVEVEGDYSSPACGLNVQIVNTIVKKFSNVKVMKKSDACAFASSNYYYLLNITR